ncbi:DUF3021 domain-containing protein [Oceanobacillus chungangensis]|uniref:DUF3021 domain-containing protein n=1 Tax=Oceanobacillus chungangensis TaxID=1229152 RepID=A0A3D8PLZ2_9BACI|nr:DUF3021 domain-containing protein [Oceanobacillus chungangensis]RDW16259.1 DUF3021 domain-containing protein [Oceanobacillus chungangensis]
MKTFLFRSLFGTFFGAFVAVVTTISIIYFGSIEQLDSEMFLRNSLGSIFCGWFFSVSPLYFEIDSLKLPTQTALHFITVTICYFVLSLGIGWIPFSFPTILLILGLFLIMYSIIWLCFYLYFKNEAKKLNAEI